MLIVAGTLIPTLLWGDLTNRNIWILTFATLAFGAIGFADDYLSVRRRRSLGLSGRKEVLAYGVDRYNEACRGIVKRYTSEWQRTVRRIARELFSQRIDAWERTVFDGATRRLTRLNAVIDHVTHAHDATIVPAERARARNVTWKASSASASLRVRERATRSSTSISGNTCCSNSSTEICEACSM